MTETQLKDFQSALKELQRLQGMSKTQRNLLEPSVGVLQRVLEGALLDQAEIVALQNKVAYLSGFLQGLKDRLEDLEKLIEKEEEKASPPASPGLGGPIG